MPLIDSQGLEATVSLGEAALENIQKLAELNYASSKDVLVNTQYDTQKILVAKDPKKVTELILANALQANSKQVVTYQRKVNNVLRDNSKGFANVIDSGIDRCLIKRNLI